MMVYSYFAPTEEIVTVHRNDGNMLCVCVQVLEICSKEAQAENIKVREGGGKKYMYIYTCSM